MPALTFSVRCGHLECLARFGARRASQTNRNRRPDYLKAFVDHLLNWEYVAEMSRAAAK